MVYMIDFFLFQQFYRELTVREATRGGMNRVHIIPFGGWFSNLEAVSNRICLPHNGQCNRNETCEEYVYQKEISVALFMCLGKSKDYVMNKWQTSICWRNGFFEQRALFTWLAIHLRNKFDRNAYIETGHFRKCSFLLFYFYFNLIRHNLRHINRYWKYTIMDNYGILIGC